jgi:hypothetical protein
MKEHEIPVILEVLEASSSNADSRPPSSRSTGERPRARLRVNTAAFRSRSAISPAASERLCASLSHSCFNMVALYPIAARYWHTPSWRSRPIRCCSRSLILMIPLPVAGTSPVTRAGRESQRVVARMSIRQTLPGKKTLIGRFRPRREAIRLNTNGRKPYQPTTRRKYSTQRMIPALDELQPARPF